MSTKLAIESFMILMSILHLYDCFFTSLSFVPFIDIWSVFLEDLILLQYQDKLYIAHVLQITKS